MASNSKIVDVIEEAMSLSVTHYNIVPDPLNPEGGLFILVIPQDSPVQHKLRALGVFVVTRCVDSLSFTLHLAKVNPEWYKDYIPVSKDDLPNFSSPR